MKYTIRGLTYKNSSLKAKLKKRVLEKQEPLGLVKGNLKNPKFIAKGLVKLKDYQIGIIMSKRSIEKLADKIIRLSPEESQQLSLIIKAKLLPEMAKKQAGLLEQAANNPKMAQMGQPRGGQMPMPTTRDAAMRGLLR